MIVFGIVAIADIKSKLILYKGDTDNCITFFFVVKIVNMLLYIKV